MLRLISFLIRLGRWRLLMASNANAEPAIAANDAAIKPTPIEILADNIPAGLKELNQWVVWNYSEKNGRFTKPPYQPDGNAKASTTDPKTWSNFKHCFEHYFVCESDGVGFVLTEQDDLVCIDLDHCLTGGTLSPTAQQIVDRFAGSAFIEKSPGGDGLHLFVRGKLPRPGNRAPGGIEAYDHKRYMTLTGHRLGGQAEPMPAQDDIDWFHETFLKHSIPAIAPPTVSVASDDCSEVTDDELIKRIRRSSTQGHKFSKLFDEGTFTHLDTGEIVTDQSVLDMKLVEMLAFWCSRDAEQMDRLFRQSALMRDKWDSSRGSETYGSITINKAIQYNLQHGGNTLKAFDLRKQLKERRRREQIAEAMRIGDGDNAVPFADKISLSESLSRFIYVGDGKGVFDRQNPSHFLNLADFKQFYAASVEHRPKTTIGIATLWADHPSRSSVITRSFKAGEGLFIKDPDGKSAVNTWSEFDRSGFLIHQGHVDAFVGHIEFIFGDEAQRFLDWLAHIEQRPGELPHTAWLSIATHTGLGRNWISSTLARVWAGRVAANFDLLGMFEKGFNGRLSGKLIACVDEIKAGGSEAWPHSEKLKSIVTEETREINPKYGRQYVEHNAVRWMIFSNHLGAIPLEANDRRWEVVINEAPPLAPEYYEKIYEMLKDQRFIESIAAYLGSRDISRFNPGAHARATAGKAHVTNISKSDLDMACEAVVDEWPSDVIFSSDLRHAVLGPGLTDRSNVNKNAMTKLGARPYGKQVKAEGRPERAWILRNLELWVGSDPSTISHEAMRGRDLNRPELFEDLSVTPVTPSNA